MKPTLLVIDHIFHQKTKSFDFLFQLLEDTFEIVVHYVDPTIPFAPPLALLDRDYVLVCQLDFLTPYFIAKRKKVVVVQMYDGSAGLADVHWIYNKQASYINFSLQMHLRALQNGCRSILLKYFPDCECHTQIRDFSTKRVFFWERLPGSLINSRFVASLLDGEVDNVHVHLSSDDQSRPSSYIPAMLGSKVTTSNWFEDRSDLEAVLDTCNIFVAPRIAEGIGHSFLEAMAKGMVVMAYDLPTHNEYIQNWRNGILFDAATSKVALGGWANYASKIGEAARQSMQTGRTEWLLQQQKLPAFMLESSVSVIPDEPFFLDFAQQTMAEYQESSAAYTAKLNDNPFAVQVFAHWASVSTLSKHDVIEEDVSRQGLNFIFGRSLHDSLLGSGWSVPELGHVWAIERECSLILKAEGLGGRGLRLIIEARANQSKLLKIAVNGRQFAVVQIGAVFNHYLLDDPLSLEGDTATLNLTVDNLDTFPPDPRTFAFMLRSIRIVPLDFKFDVHQVLVGSTINHATSIGSDATRF